MSSRNEELLEAILNGEAASIVPQSRNEELLLAALNGEAPSGTPQSRMEALLYAVAENGLGDGSGVTIKNQPKTITENGTYTHDSGYTGLGAVTVNVPIPEPEEPVLQDIEVTENGEYSAGEGYDGLGVVTVNVDGSGGGVETGEITLTRFHNDEYPLTIPVSAKYSHILVVPPVMSEFKATYAGKYQHGFYAEENYGYIGMSINSVTDAGVRGAGNAYWEDETQTTFRADFTETEITVYPENYAAFGFAGATYKWFVW